ncbi:G-protein coupled receptor activity [Pristimantis euphronides]
MSIDRQPTDKIALPHKCRHRLHYYLGNQTHIHEKPYFDKNGDFIGHYSTVNWIAVSNIHHECWPHRNRKPHMSCQCDGGIIEDQQQPGEPPVSQCQGHSISALLHLHLPCTLVHCCHYTCLSLNRPDPSPWASPILYARSSSGTAQYGHLTFPPLAQQCTDLGRQESPNMGISLSLHLLSTFGNGLHRHPITVSYVQNFSGQFYTPVIFNPSSEFSFFHTSSKFALFLPFHLLLDNLNSRLHLGHLVNITCMLSQVSFGILFSVALSCTLAKTVMVCIAFRTTKPGSSWQCLIGSKWSNSLVLFYSSFQVIIWVSWLTLAPPSPLSGEAHCAV